MGDFKQPYADAGHEVESLFSGPSHKCAKCGANQIDLSEDMAYGEMRKCTSVSDGKSGQ